MESVQFKSGTFSIRDGEILMEGSTMPTMQLKRDILTTAEPWENGVPGLPQVMTRLASHNPPAALPKVRHCSQESEKPHFKLVCQADI